MREAFSNAQKDLLRSRPQGARWRLAIHRPASIVSFTKTHEIDTHPPSSIAWDPPPDVQAASRIEAGMTGWVGTFLGASDLGKIRIRKDYNGTFLEIAEAGSGLINWKAANYITVYEEFRPWTRHLRYDTATSQWVMDFDEAYEDQLEVYRPYLNMGAPFIGYGPIVTGSWVGDRSLFWDSASATALWTFPNGTTSSNIGSSDNPVVQTFSTTSPNGAYVKLEVTNAAGTSSVGRRLMFKFDNKAHAPRVSFGTIEGGVEGGYRATLTAFDVGPETIPDGAEIVIWEDASYNGVASAIGGNTPFRNNIVFRGWVINETQQVNPFTGAVTFEAATIDGYMDRSVAYDLFMAQSDPVHSGSHWIDSRRLSLDRVADNLLRYRSTVGGIVDFYPASGLAITEQILFQSLAEGTWWQQMKVNYHEKGWLGYVAADLQSNIFAFADNQITGGSNNIPFAMHLEARDRRDTVEIDHPHIDENAQVQLYAVTGDSPLGAESPGTAKGYFGGHVEHQRGLMTDSQDTLITWAGNYRAKLNNKYPRVKVPLAGNYRIDPVPQCRVTTSLSPNKNPRGIGWNDKSFFPKTLSLEYDSTMGVVKSAIEMEAVVNGIGGSAITFPKPDDIVPYPTDPPSEDPEPPDPVPPQGGGFGTCYVMTINTLGRTRDLSASSPEWSDIKGGITGDMKDFILDPWLPTTTGYVLTSSGVWRSQDLDQVSPTWSNVLTSAAITTATGGFNQYWHITSSINFDGYLAIFFRNNSTTIYCAVSGDRGDTWNYYNIGTVSSTVDGWQGGADIVPHNVSGARRLYCAFRSTGLGQAVFRSDNDGVTWSHVGSIGTGGGECWSLHVPYNDNPTGSIVYASMEGNASDRGIWRSTDAGVNWTRLQSDIGATEHLIHRINTEGYTQDRLNMFTWLCVSGAGADTLYTSTDGLSTKNVRSMTGFSGDVKACGGFPFVSGQFYALTDAGIFVTVDGGDNWTTKTGDWSFGFSFGTGENRRGVVVPLWTE